ncbi:MAG: hypothetical protein ACLQFR_21055 [Streptosporangiaceae bacterium]
MMAGTLTLRVRRRRGALSGVLLVLLGIWGALIPFVGPYFHYAYTPDRTWAVTAGRMWLEVLPGAAALVTGIVVLISRLRPVAVFAAWLAALAGAWFAVGTVVAAHWTTLPDAGTPVGGPARMALEQAGFFSGLGVVIVFVAAVAVGRLTVIAASDAAALAASRDAGPAAADTGTAISVGSTTASRFPAVRLRRTELREAGAAASTSATDPGQPG